MRQSVKVLGIMNGTSLDGVDYALIEADPELKNLRFIKHKATNIPNSLRDRLLLAATDKLSTYQVSELHFDLGRLYGDQVQKLGASWSFDLVGLHGQTIHHEGGKASLQIGHPGFIAAKTAKPVYYDFRAADIVAGGEGAPFAPFFQRAIARDLKQPVAFHNLGGISNLTYQMNSKFVAFDTGPANILLDSWMMHKTGKPFDRHGRTAQKGLPEPKLVNQFLKHPYFKLRPPKSTGRELFNLDFIKKHGGRAFARLPLPDQLATLSEVTAISIRNAYQNLGPEPSAIYFYGGGINNDDLMKRLKFYLPHTELLTTQALGWPPQAFEASVFAFLAAGRHFNKIVHAPEVTGAKKAVLLGSVYS